MRGAIPPGPTTSLWRGAYLGTGKTSPFTFTFMKDGITQIPYFIGTVYFVTI